jgi:hypothetical protein
MGTFLDKEKLALTVIKSDITLAEMRELVRAQSAQPVVIVNPEPSRLEFILQAVKDDPASFKPPPRRMGLVLNPDLPRHWKKGSKK